ncbi:cardiolipin synthase [Microvirga flavescens]|uniref:cardiolipin synthase n=1 Tax=Microvirga flavescens TaxID=2249811 RepID=UPI000DDA8F2D|nr:cardiolipin synthase [Microvirga flavescens]
MHFEGSTWALLYLVSEWIIRLVMLVVVPVRRSPDAAKGWLLLAFFLPWPALVLYVLIGRPSYPSWRNERVLKLPGLLQDAVARAAPFAEPAGNKTSVGAETRSLVEKLGRFPPLSGNDIMLLPDYDGSIDALIADIERAEKNVHLLYFIFADDRTGQKVMAALARAVERGVTCRVLIDAVGSRPWAKKVIAQLAASGVAAHVALPITLRWHPARADLRNHRKIAVIDGRIGYTGSQNIADADFKPGVVNQELVVRTWGPIVTQLQAVFAADWFLETQERLSIEEIMPEPAAVGTVQAQVLPSGPDVPGSGIEGLIVTLVYGARKRVVMTTPYFIPDASLLKALETAALRGVDVHIVVSQIPDHRLVNLAQRSYYDELLSAGVKLHLFRDKLLHAKHFTFDDGIGLVGSSNIDIRSFILNSEVSLIAYDEDVTARLYAEQQRCFAASDLLDLAQWRARPAVVKLCENLARLISPLL